ncbi:MAG: FHA domain-containing protein [Planctomycetes bacterium]|nr:FHA domain-containing protein [Planctomycetota bacterium]
MSLFRLIVWSCLLGGWAAFASWLITELPFHYWIDEVGKLATFLAIVMATVVSIAIGGGVSLASGLTNPQFFNLAKRTAFGFAGGLIGGLIGTLLGTCIFSIFQDIKVLGFMTRVIGWTLIGLGIGVTEGLFERNFKKVRNGLIGGGLGGFFAGVFFVPISLLASSMSSRALSFVLLGLFIGFFIGLAQVILKEAWLTVEGGFRAGRQMILGNDVITMGTSEKSSLIFIAFGAKGVEPTHLKITRQPDGRYLLEDNQSRNGTLLNGKPVTAPTPLIDGDAIQFGVNVVRFNERAKHGERPPVFIQQPAQAIPAEAIKAAPPPSPVRAAPTAPPPAAIQPAPPPAPPKPAPAAAPKPAPAPPQEGPCPSCGKKVVGIPGQRFCKSCFQTF